MTTNPKPYKEKIVKRPLLLYSPCSLFWVLRRFHKKLQCCHCNIHRIHPVTGFQNIEAAFISKEDHFLINRPCCLTVNQESTRVVSNTTKTLLGDAVIQYSPEMPRGFEENYLYPACLESSISRPADCSDRQPQDECVRHAKAHLMGDLD